MLHSLTDSFRKQAAIPDFSINEKLSEKARIAGMSVVAVPDVDTFSYFPAFNRAVIGFGIKLPFPRPTTQRHLQTYRTVVFELTSLVNHEMAGFVALIYQADTASKEAMEMEYLALLPQYQGQGLGRLLVECATQVAAVMQCQSLCTEPRSDTKIINFFKHLGFRVNDKGTYECTVQPMPYNQKVTKPSLVDHSPEGCQLKKVPLKHLA